MQEEKQRQEVDPAWHILPAKLEVPIWALPRQGRMVEIQWWDQLEKAFWIR